jgi:undecaprenyl-diphosphatase
VAVSLVVGGFAILLIERNLPATTTPTVDDMRPGLAFKIGLVQCLAMIPGVSRSGATIMGSLLLGLSRPAAAEFSFFLAIPTMVAATAYDLWKNRAFLSLDDAGIIAIGFGMAFLCALLVVRALVAFVSRHGFAPFAWYRIALGAAALVGLWLVSS